ncbi:unnamed protein product [Parnassius apollo]|uniref:(apollo) hypothetical protein n=1 Tax=Parnassius apollo TaxID=110799 RepID=A0A8S3XG19_PARAO|nr:unnamed protein product [Parnassius apollo]
MLLAAFRIINFMSIITVVFNKHNIEFSEDRSTEIDYSELATLAESNKKDVLGFLNDEKVRKRYRELYDTLLDNLIGTRRRGNPYNSLETLYNFKSVNNQSEYATSTRRIVHGRNTSIAAVPWQVSLREKTYPICGGSIITDIWLITAAHCLIKARANELSVRLGSSWKTRGGEMYDVKECHVHPRYNSKTKICDVGLVQLYSPLRFSAKILPIRLVAKESRLPADQPAVVSGWGKLREGGPSATYLQSSTVKTIAMKLCRRSGLDRRAIDPASMFCAGSFSQPAPDACQGDSGGPLVQDGVLIGVVSWGLGCARGNFPGVYTRLSSPIIWDWIQNLIIKNSNKNA